MDTSVLIEPAPVHPHAERRLRGRTIRLAVAASLAAAALVLVLLVALTSGPADQVAAAPAHLTGGTDLAGGSSGDESSSLGFSAALPDGPIQIGARGELAITVSNPREQPLLLEGVSVSVTGTSEVGCRAEWLVVQPYRPRREHALTIPPGETSRVLLSYTLTDIPGTNQDACKGARFSLSITGSGHSV